MDQRVVPGVVRIVEGHCAQHFAGGREGDFNRIVHPAAAEHLQIAAVRPTRKDPRGKPLAQRASLAVDKLVPMTPVAPVDAAARTEKTTVNAGRVARKAELGNQLFPQIGNAVAIGVFEPPDIGRAGHVQRAAAQGLSAIEGLTFQIQNGERMIVWPKRMAEAKYILPMPSWDERP